MIKYMVQFKRIEKLNVIKESEKSVLVEYEGFKRPDSNEPPPKFTRRQLKNTSYQHVFDTWKEAHEYLLKECEKSINGLKENLYREVTRLEKIKQMKEF